MENDMRTCDIDGCERKHLAKGLCRTHYNQQSPNRRKIIDYPCDGCGKVIKKEASRLNRYPTLYCTPKCKTDSEWSDRWFAEGAKLRPARGSLGQMVRQDQRLEAACH